jgi:hypothetical protein
VIENKTISGDVTIAAANVTIRNSKVTGSIAVARPGVGARIITNTVPVVSISSSQDVVIERNDMGFASDKDTMHVTSDNGAKVTDVRIANNYIHDPFTSGNHYDGLQVRGADRLTVYCNNFDLGAPQEYYNAAVYLEPANGGHSGVVVDNNWLFGGAFGFMYGPDNDGMTRLTNNHFGGQYLWQSDTSDAACYGSAVPAVQSGNDLRGVPFTPCP